MDRIFKQNIISINKKKSNIHAILIASSNILFPWFVAILVWKIILINIYIGFILLPFTMFYIGTRFRSVNNMSHETFHFAFCQNPKINNIYGEIFAIFEFSKFKSVRTEHITHHSYLGDFNKDKDFEHLETYAFWLPMCKSTLKKHFLRGISLRFIHKYLFFVIYDKESPLWAKIARFVYILSLLILIFLFPIPMILFFVIPYLTFYQIQKYFTDVVDHGGLLKNKDEIMKTRNFIITNKLLASLLLPRNDGYHLIHHLLPALAVERFRKAHLLLMEDETYKNLDHYAHQQFKNWINKQ